MPTNVYFVENNFLVIRVNALGAIQGTGFRIHFTISRRSCEFDGPHTGLPFFVLFPLVVSAVILPCCFKRVPCIMFLPCMTSLALLILITFHTPYFVIFIPYLVRAY